MLMQCVVLLLLCLYAQLMLLLDAHTALTTDAFPQSLSCRVVNDCVK
jgi:ABC-type uncharacterized transport system ATPase component